MDLSEEKWIDRLSEGSGAQSEALAELREILIKRIGYSFRNEPIVDEAFTDDIVQETLIKILNSLSQFEGRSKFTTWATTIAIRTVYTELRRKRWKDVSLDSLLASQGDFISTAEKPNESLQEKRQLIDAMHTAIQNHLTEKQRIALKAELEGMPMEEIGRRTGSNRNAIYKLMHDARKKLRKELESKGFSLADFSPVSGEQP